MTLPTHAITGLVIGTALGHPIAGMLIGCLPDVDHFYSYIKHGYLKNWKTFYHNAFGKEDAVGDQRNILHNVFIAAIISLLVFFFAPIYFPVFSLAYASHLILDAIDTSDYYPLFPWKGINIRGFINFYSWQEGILFILLLVSFLFIKIPMNELTQFVINYFGLIGVVIFNYAYLPQIVHLIRKKDSTGISIGSWCIWLFGALILLVHAIAISDMVFIALTTIESILLLVCILLAIKYKK